MSYFQTSSAARGAFGIPNAAGVYTRRCYRLSCFLDAVCFDAELCAHKLIVLSSDSSELPIRSQVESMTTFLILGLVFLTSTWYIKNPFLKNKIIEAWALNISDDRQRSLRILVNTHPLAVKHLDSALINFYIGASTVP